MPDFDDLSIARRGERRGISGESDSTWEREKKSDPETIPQKVHLTDHTVGWLRHHLRARVAWKAGIITREQLIAVLRNETPLVAVLAKPVTRASRHERVSA